MVRSGEEPLSIGTFARRSRLSPKALRLYDRLGVLTPARVADHNGYRLYTEDQLETARLVGLLRRLQMPLAQVRRVVAAPPDEQRALLDSYWAEVEGRVAAQRDLVEHLRSRISGEANSHDRFTIEERRVPEQRVLTALRHTTVGGLSPWLGDTLARLSAEAGDLPGGRAGFSFVIFHGQVNEDSDGPVEVCAPIACRDDLATPHRVETAHQEVFTSITVAQVAFPQILSAYEAVEQWVADHGREISGPPREVYVDGFDRLRPHEMGCLVAFPVRP